MTKRRILVITGATRGIGAATVALAVREGYHVVLNCRRDTARAAAMVAAIKSAGGSAEAIAADVGDPVEVARMFNAIAATHGIAHALVNNAGVTGLRAPLPEQAHEQAHAVMQTNYFGAFYCMQHAAVLMRDGGSIVNVSSQAATNCGPGLGPYAASKAALNALTISSARELGPRGIRVNAVAPGLIATEQQGELTRERAASVPLGRYGEAHEVAAAILWLLSDQASYLSGAVLPVTGAR